MLAVLPSVKMKAHMRMRAYNSPCYAEVAKGNYAAPMTSKGYNGITSAVLTILIF